MALWRRILRFRPDELTLHDAIYETLRQSPVRLSEISNRTGFPYDTLKSWTVEPDNPSGALRAMPVYAVPPVVNATGNFAILDAQESACNRVAFVMPAIEQAPQDVVIEEAAAIQAFGTLIADAAAAIADQRLTMAEIEQIDTGGYHAIQHILRLMASARAAATPEARG